MFHRVETAADWQMMKQKSCSSLLLSSHSLRPRTLCWDIETLKTISNFVTASNFVWAPRMLSDAELLTDLMTEYSVDLFSMFNVYLLHKLFSRLCSVLWHAVSCWVTTGPGLAPLWSVMKHETWQYIRLPVHCPTRTRFININGSYNALDHSLPHSRSRVTPVSDRPKPLIVDNHWL